MSSVNYVPVDERGRSIFNPTTNRKMLLTGLLVLVVVLCIVAIAQILVKSGKKRTLMPNGMVQNAKLDESKLPNQKSPTPSSSVPAEGQHDHNLEKRSSHPDQPHNHKTLNLANGMQQQKHNADKHEPHPSQPHHRPDKRKPHPNQPHNHKTVTLAKGMMMQQQNHSSDKRTPHPNQPHHQLPMKPHQLTQLIQSTMEKSSLLPQQPSMADIASLLLPQQPSLKLFNNRSSSSSPLLMSAPRTNIRPLSPSSSSADTVHRTAQYSITDTQQDYSVQPHHQSPLNQPQRNEQGASTAVPAAPVAISAGALQIPEFRAAGKTSLYPTIPPLLEQQTPHKLTNDDCSPLIALNTPAHVAQQTTLQRLPPPMLPPQQQQQLLQPSPLLVPRPLPKQQQLSPQLQSSQPSTLPVPLPRSRQQIVTESLEKISETSSPDSTLLPLLPAR